MIYAHLMEVDKPNIINNELQRQDDLFAYPANCVDIRRTPSVLRVCTQIRAECHQMFLADTDFIAFVGKQDGIDDPVLDSGYRYFLDLLNRLGPGHVRLIKSITIVCHDSIGEFNYPRPSPRYGLMDMWNKFIPHILGLGVKPTQLRWPGVSFPDSATRANCHLWKEHSNSLEHWYPRQQPTTTNAHHRKELSENVLRMAVLYKSIVEPALFINGCLDPGYPPANVLKQAEIAVPEVFGLGSWAWLVVSEMRDFFNLKRYNDEQNPERKEHWRRRATVGRNEH